MSNRAAAVAEWQFIDPFDPINHTEALLNKLRAFCLPGGEEAARHIHAIHIQEKGEMRATPRARWIPFTAQQTIDTSQSNFCWKAHLDGKLLPVSVIDGYEHHHGRLLAKVGPLTTQRVEGIPADKGELQRYLASFIYCPAMLLNNPALEWTSAGLLTLRVRDREDATGAAVDIELTDGGKPLACRADRPRMVGREFVITPWLAVADDFSEHEGLRVPRRLDVSWLIADGWFSYYRSVVTEFSVSIYSR